MLYIASIHIVYTYIIRNNVRSSMKTEKNFPDIYLEESWHSRMYYIYTIKPRKFFLKVKINLDLGAFLILLYMYAFSFSFVSAKVRESKTGSTGLLRAWTLHISTSSASICIKVGKCWDLQVRTRIIPIMVSIHSLYSLLLQAFIDQGQILFAG
jgi:hypothetical protein